MARIDAKRLGIMKNDPKVCICLAHNYPEALSHCDQGHDLTSVAFIVNIADLRSAFVKTLASKHFRQNAADNAP